jgi:hypothetical protein
MQWMPITTDVSSNPAQGEVYNIVIKFVNDLRQVGGYSEYEIVIFFYRTFGLMNQDDSPDRINFYQTERKS